MVFPHLKKDVSLSERVYQSIYEQIVSGELKPREKITEAWLADTMGISRAPVREALKRLAEDRLVVLVPRSGCYIADVTPEEIEEIYEIRKRLECMALEYAFDKFDCDRLIKLRDKFIHCRKINSLRFVKKAIKLDTQFHNLILQKSSCLIVQEMLQKIQARVQKFRVSEADYLDRARAALEEHIDILQSMIESDKDAAIIKLMNHIEHTKKNVLNISEKKTE